MSNQINRQRLTVSEWLLLYIVTTYAPTTRLVSQMTIIKAKEMAWLVPIASCIVYIPLLAVVAVIVNQFSFSIKYGISVGPNIFFLSALFLLFFFFMRSFRCT
jgi:hypothetical protein